MRKVLLSAVMGLGLVGCASGGQLLPGGYGWINLSKQGGMATSAASMGSKTGKACAMGVLGIVTIGDSTIAEAKAQGGITTVASVDYEVTNIIGIYSSVCTVVRGD